MGGNERIRREKEWKKERKEGGRNIEGSGRENEV